MQSLTDKLPALDGTFDLVVVGSGFGSLFYLAEALTHLPSDARVLLLERGLLTLHDRQIALGANAFDPENPQRVAKAEYFYERETGEKPWNFTIALGGGTLCWWGQAPRLHPADFDLARRYGQGRDWPIGYDDLEPFYGAAEEIIGISGDSARVGPFWRSNPYPLPPFRGSSADETLRTLRDDQLPIPCARDSIGRRRAQCCAFGECRLCPHDAKFTALNGLRSVLEDPRLKVLTGATVVAVEIEAGVARGVLFTRSGRLKTVGAQHVVLGANSIFNPTILQRSGLSHPELGRGLTEQMGVTVEIKLATLSGVDGGTSGTGMNIALIDGPHRATRGAAVYYFDNRWKHTGLRLERGKHLNTLTLIINSEDLRQAGNRIEVPEDWREKPRVRHGGFSRYARDGLAAALAELPGLLRGLDVEEIGAPVDRPTESHLQCTTPAGTDPALSIVDRDLLHHRVRNLAVVGTSVFPTCPVGNPSLTAAAWSLMAARRHFSTGGQGP